MSDGSHTPTTPCDGISGGLAFEGEAVTLGPIGDLQPEPPDPCATP